MPNYEHLLKEALVSIRELRQQLAEREAEKTESVAVVGIGCRFPPDVRSPEEFWSLLEAGVDAITEISTDRWDSDYYHCADPDAPGKICTRFGGFLAHKDLFDPRVFKISPREAAYMDPQQRLLLEVAWEALEHANIPSESLHGSDTGVFIGISAFDYANLVAEYLPDTDVDPAVGTGAAHSAASGRLSYVFGFRGPSVSVDTACSSSLVSVYAAVESLRRRECRLALAGGVNMMLSPFNHIVFSRARMLSPDGRCKAFDESANGYGRSEGAGLLVLKRVSDALADRDNILALIRGGAVNHAGASGGLTVPNGPAQQDVIRNALRNAGVTAAAVDYVEAHGTGTALGDPIELTALGEVFADRQGGRPLLVGSAKTNIGHMEAAAGVGGLIKVILQLQRGAIAPHLHLTRPSSRIAWSRLPIAIPTQLLPWPASDEKKRIAGVSSFGFSGTNAHLVIEEAPRPHPRRGLCERPLHLLTLSAKSETSLNTLVRAYASRFQSSSDCEPADLGYSANAGRSHLSHRRAIIGASTSELCDKLTALRDGDRPAGVFAGVTAHADPPKIAFLFTGQGSQYSGMGRELYETSPVFREILGRCDAVLQRETGWSLLNLLYAKECSLDVHQTAYAQPLLFALEYALATLWRSWGVEPTLMAGHSVGEYAAAAIAGVFSLEDGLRLAAARGKLMQALPRDGEMVAVHGTQEVVQHAIESYSSEVSIAAINGPRNIVISGATRAVREIVAALERAGVRSIPLEVSHAFHSPLMTPMLDGFAETAGTVTYAVPRTGMVSNLTGCSVRDEIATAEYWVQHICMPVRFQDSVHALRQAGCTAFLEIGPKPTLTKMARACMPGNGGNHQWLASLNPVRRDWEQMLESLAALYVRGHKIHWEGFDQGYARRRVQLPTYPFERERYWFAPHVLQKKIAKRTPQVEHSLLGVRMPAPPSEDNQQGNRIVFESRLAEDSPAFLGDHRVFGKTIFPAAGYLELAASAGLAALGTYPTLRNIAIRSPLLLRTGVPTLVQTVLEQKGDSYRFEIRSRVARNDDDSAAWQLHAKGFLDTRSPSPRSAGDLFCHDQQITQSVDVQSHYEKLRRRGLDYGPSFRCVRELRTESRRALGRVKLSENLANEQSAFVAHPVLLDGAFHMLAGVLEESDETATYLPTGVESVSLLKPLGAEHWVDVTLQPTGQPDAAALTADVRVFSPDGSVAVQITGLRLTRTTDAALQRAIDGDPGDLAYAVRWPPKPLARDPGRSMELRRVLIFADRGRTALAVSDSLKDEGIESVMVFSEPREDIRTDSNGNYTINPARQDHFSRVLREPHQGVLYFWGLDVPKATEETAIPLTTNHLLGCDPLLNLVKALEAGCGPIWLVTRGAFPVDARSDVTFEQAALTGLARVVRIERPKLRCTQIDLERDLDRRSSEAETRQVVSEVLSGDGEEEVALRGGLRHVTRLERLKRGAASRRSVASRPSRLRLSQSGTIDNLALEPFDRRAPGKGEVEVAVRAAGVNFKDVLHVLGMLERHAREHGTEWVERTTLGYECGGVIVRVGEGVEGRRIGDAVIGYGTDCLSSHVILNAEAVVAKPANLTFDEAAGLPTVFLTAYHALHTLARVRPGETVLIHAAAGGVGQAAIQLCRRIGARVLATASPAKWDFLKSQGISLVMSSRNLDFKDRVLEATNGRGVDVVLNSINGEFIPANLTVLAHGGRFVEIGKLGIWTAEQIVHARPDVSYFTFDLSEVADSVSAGFKPVLAEITSWLEQNAIGPVPVVAFPAEKAHDAFRYLAHARNIGKVVISFASADPPKEKTIVRPDRSYLVTGGLGALGLEVAEWLVGQGVRHLVVCGRSKGPTEARATLAGLEARGARVEVFAADMANRQDVISVLTAIDATMPPLAGIVHAAGVLDDGILQEQSAERFERVMAPKINGAWNLHSLTRGLPLDWFVCFASLSGVLGSAGQANYSAANACMDALMHHRRFLGLPGISIDWGPWGSVGMAATLDPAQRRRLQARGLQVIEVGRGLSALDYALRLDAAQVVAASVEWPKFTAQAGAVPRLLEGLIRKQKDRTSSSREADHTVGTIDRLRAVPEAERSAILLAHLRHLLSRTLGFPSHKPIDARDSFFDLGMDSLSAVEFDNQIQATLGCALPVTALFDYPTPGDLAGYLLGRMFAGEGANDDVHDHDRIEAYAARSPRTDPQQLAREMLNT
jgi:acyl transferase domain-containing protein/acyl carrier protein